MPNPAHILRNGSRLLRTREALLAGPGAGAPALRAEIEASWRRSVEHGVLRDRLVVPHAESAESDGLLRLAAGPVADAVGTDLAGTGVSLLLSDHEARILDRRVPDAQVRAKLDRLSLAPGFQFGEDTVGTTAISLALSEQSPALVAAGEHYADTFTELVCAAAPVIDRRTGRVVGTIGLACRVDAASPLMVALVKRAARDIERQLVDGKLPGAYPPEPSWDTLTATERNVAAIIAEGATNREAAAQMFLSRHTIDFHLRQIFRKLGVASRVELTRHVLARGTGG